jgi:NNP family nitrate/nitrite transporter-like MFS transporter
MRDYLKVTVRNKYVWILAGSILFAFSAHISFTSVLQSALGSKGVPAIAAGFYGALYQIGSLAGCLITPPLVSKRDGYKPILACYSLLGAVGIAFAWLAPQGILLGGGLFLTGIVLGGIITLFYSLPVQLPGIGNEYAGTAGGISSTLQMAGPVILSSMIVVPLTQGSYPNMYLVTGAQMIVVLILSFFMPEIRRR